MIDFQVRSMFSRWINFSIFPCWTRGLIYSRQYSRRLFAARSLRIFLTLGQFSSCLSEVASLAALSYCSCHRFKPCLFFLRVHCKYVENLYSRLQGQVKGPNWMSSPFDFKRGVFQGDPLSPIIFLTVFNPIVQHLKSIEEAFIRV